MTGRIDKTELIAKLRQLEGLTDDERNSLIDLLTRQKRYGLVWEDKTEDVEERLRDHLPVLREVKERRIIGQADGEADKPEGLLRAQAGGEAERNPCEADRTTIHNPERVTEHSAAPSGLSYSAMVAGVGTPACSLESSSGTCPNHILIEGDNLEALTALSYTHEGKIDVIYIDPPYNTGKKDEFKYNDYWVDSEDTYRHSKWLSFMDKRLRLAKRLLRDDGLIFISIDDNEIGHLKVLCDEIFTHNSNPDTSNSLGVLIWDLGSGTSAGHFTRSHEYILAYCKKKSLLPNFSGGDGVIDDRAIKKKSIKNAESEYTFKRGTKFEAEDGTEFTGQWGGTEITKLISGRMLCQNGMLAEDVTLAACWTQRNQMDSFFDGKDTYDTKGQHVIEFYFRDNGKLYCRKDRDKINPPSVLRGIATTKQGSSLIKELFNDEEPIGFAKPLNLITFMLSLKNNDSTILDFFAGSGTTLHATMQLNAEDGGHRQCILVTNNENGICEQVTYERNKRVIQGYTTPKGEQVAGLTRNNLRYYRTELLPRTMTFKARQELMRASADLLCIKEDIYSERREFGGMKFRPSLLRYFREADGRQMLLVFDERAVAHVVPLIERLEGRLKVYVFSNGPYAYEDEFARVKERVELCALPEALLQVYRKVLPKDNEEEVRI